MVSDEGVCLFCRNNRLGRQHRQPFPSSPNGEWPDICRGADYSTASGFLTVSVTSRGHVGNLTKPRPPARGEWRWEGRGCRFLLQWW